MKIQLALHIAKTHLFAKKKQTVIASLGVTFGIAMFILMISFMTGVNEVLEDSALNSTPHIHIFHDVDPNRRSILDEKNNSPSDWNIVHHMKAKDEQLNLKNGFAIADRIRQEPSVLGVSPQLSSQVFFNNGPTQLSGILAGVDIVQEDKLYDVRSKIKSGSIEELLSSSDGILMGTGLAEKLNVKKGDKVTITTPMGHTMLLRIVGTFQYGLGPIDQTRSYANISTVQKVLQKDTRYITDISIKVKDIEDATPLANKFRAMFHYTVEDWQTTNASILVSFKIRNILTYVVVTTLLVVAGFGIYNIMNMTVQDKLKDIAILKATGFEGKDIVNIFLLQAVIIGIMGGTVGLLLGFALSYALSTVPFDGGGFLSIDTFPVNFDPIHYVSGMLFGVMTTVFAGYFPSRKASGIDPVRILRG